MYKANPIEVVTRALFAVFGALVRACGGGRSAAVPRVPASLDPIVGQASFKTTTQGAEAAPERSGVYRVLRRGRLADRPAAQD